MKKYANNPPVLYDRVLVFVAVSLIALGLLMVTSASMVISEKLYSQPFHYLIRQAIYLAMGLILALSVLRTPVAVWQRMGKPLIIFSIILLLLVLIPGVGKTVNGSTRWLNLGFVRIQVSEIVKLAVVIYLAGYIVRHHDALQKKFGSFIRPLILLGMIAALLLRQPDFGASVVIMITAMGMLFLAGVRLRHFLAVLILVASAVVILAISSPYRLARLTTFLNPWANPYASGYQLTQALIAFGRGGWFGVGLGESVQKLFYLPEAHTDFLFAVLAEELGIVGAFVVIILFTILVWHGFSIARRALRVGDYFSGYLTFGLTLWLGLQAIINIGVSSGVLPTKGITLPLMSAGGSSMLINCIVLALILRVDHETRWKMLTIGESALRLEDEG